MLLLAIALAIPLPAGAQRISTLGYPSVSGEGDSPVAGPMRGPDFEPLRFDPVITGAIIGATAAVAVYWLSTRNTADGNFYGPWPFIILVSVGTLAGAGVGYLVEQIID